MSKPMKNFRQERGPLVLKFTGEVTLTAESLAEFLEATPERHRLSARVLGGPGDGKPSSTGPLLLGMGASAKLLGVYGLRFGGCCAPEN